MKDRIARWASGKKYLELREMFGVSTFLHLGNFLAAADGDDLVIRLSQADEAEARKLRGARLWRSGGPGTAEYTLIPAEALAEDAALSAWLDKALEHVSTLEPKERLIDKDVIRPDFLTPS